MSVAQRPSSSTDLPPLDERVARRIYHYRWWATALALSFVVGVFALGVSRVARFSADVASLADTSNGNGAVKPLAFDPSMDVWFGEHDAAVSTYYDIERTFVAEDFVMVTYEVADTAEGGSWGVFERDSLATIARLTERFLTIPGVRHVRSLTYNPWIRWGAIQDESGSEEGLIISDLVQGDPKLLTDSDIVERMVAVLGAARTAERVGEARVRAVIGEDADFANFIGEPLLLGTILSESGSTTAIQVQVLRPRIDAEQAADTFTDENAQRVGPNLSSIERQRAAVRGIEHFLRLEQGLAVPTPQYAALEQAIAAMPAGEARNARRLELLDSSKNFIRSADGTLVRKFFEYDRIGDQLVDMSDPSDRIIAADDFVPQPLSAYDYHLGGVPLFERNFERVGLADGKYVPLMFLVIAILLALIFRSISGVLIPFVVVFGSVMAMLGIAFSSGKLLNNLTMLSPNMLTAVGIADAIHLVAAWVLLRGEYDDKKALITEVIRRNALPVFLTSITTAVGFYSLTTSSLVPVGMLGSMAAIGTFFAWALSMTTIPALLSLVPHRKVTMGSRLARVFSVERSSRFVDAVLGRRKRILVIAAGVFCISAFGLSRVTIDSDFRSMFPGDNPVMSDFTWIEARMGGVGDLEIIFRSSSADNDPRNSNRAEATALTAEQEQQLVALELRAQGAKSQREAFAPLDDTEALQLERLQEAQAAWDARRIGVSTQFLGALERFERRLREEMVQPSSDLAVLTDFISPLDVLRKIHQVQHQNQSRYYRVPGEEDVPEALRQVQLEYDEWTEEWDLTPAQSGNTMVAQYYLQYESGARPGESLATQLSADRTQFRVQGRVKQASSAAHLRAFERILEIARHEFPELVAQRSSDQSSGPADSGAAGATPLATTSDFVLSGKSLLFARTSDLFAKGFVSSMAVALTAITLLIGLLFRSWRFAAISLIPNVMPIILPLSVFGLLGIPLDGPAILVSSVALGVCVDDTIHFFTKFVRARRRGESPRDALVYSLTQAGAAMTITTLVLIIGFATLLLSDFAPNFQMGALAALMIGLAWIADFVVTAAVLSFGRNSTAVMQASSSETTSAVETVAQ